MREVREETIEIAGLRAIAVGDLEEAEQVVVMLHGFQMQPSDLSPFAHSLREPAWFLFPEGPLEADGGGRAWWHIDSKKRDAAIANGPRDFAEQHPPDLPSAREKLVALIAEVRARIGARPLVLGGFSQGAMLTCDTVLRSSFDLSAMLLFSGSRIGFDEWEKLDASRLKGLPVLVSHGKTDADLSFAAGTALHEFLVAKGADLTWVPFDQGHEIPLVVWRTLRKFLAHCRSCGVATPIA